MSMPRTDLEIDSVDDSMEWFGRRPFMTLLSGQNCIFSHCVRIVLLEKDVECNVEFIPNHGDPSQLLRHNPYGETPTLVDRDISLYGVSVILEYLDERFPHPPLMPVDPITRAKTRLMLSRWAREWLLPIDQLGDTLPTGLPESLRQSIHDGLVALSPLLREQPFFNGEEYTLAETFVAPLLWRLPMMGVDLPKQAAPMLEYGAKLFERPAFRGSLSELEKEMRVM